MLGDFGKELPGDTNLFRQKPDNSNSHEFELHRPSNKGTKLLLKVIKAIIIIMVDLLDPEIPGLSAPPEQSSFDFVTSKVRAQLGHLSFQKQEDILTLLRGYKDTVFETPTVPRMPPRR